MTAIGKQGNKQLKAARAATGVSLLATQYTLKVPTAYNITSGPDTTLRCHCLGPNLRSGSMLGHVWGVAGQRKEVQRRAEVEGAHTHAVTQVPKRTQGFPNVRAEQRSRSHGPTFSSSLTSKPLRPLRFHMWAETLTGSTSVKLCPTTGGAVHPTSTPELLTPDRGP